MRSSEPLVLRAGFIALAVALWRQGALLIVTGLLPVHVPAVILLMVTVLGGLALVLLASAAASSRPERHGWIAFAVLAVIVVATGYRDALFKATSETMPTTDAHLYMDVAARYLLAGKNPYAESLAEAFRMYHLPLSYSTPLIDGDFTDRAAYPALSFLVLVPAVLFHAPTYLVFTGAFVLGLALLLRRTPVWLRGVAVAPFVIDDTFLNFAFGGITDTVWAALLIGAALLWHKKLRWSAVLVGLACAHKQHPWFVVPYLALRLWHERGELPWRGETRVFLGIVAGVFLALNLPFFAWGPSAYIAGVTEPLRAPMVQLSDGLTVLGMTGLARMPRTTTSLLFWAVYAVSLVIYARHTKTLRDACWIFPALVLWFGYRALASYWYLYAPVALAALVTHDDGAPPPADRARSWRIDGALAGALGLAAIAFVVASVRRSAPFVLEVVPPLETWGTQVFELHVRVTSRLGHATYPRFTVQSRSLQPMQWIRKDGPLELYPGQTGDYVLKAPYFFNEIGSFEGARIAVSDDGDPFVRSFTELPADRTPRRIDAIQDPDLRFIETRSGAPVSWGFDRSDTSVTLAPFPRLDGDARLRVTFDASAGSPATPSDRGLAIVSGHLHPLAAGPRHGDLFTTLALPEAPIAFHVNVPPNANRPPYDTLYGLSLAVPTFRGMVLFGEDGKGRLPNGEPFVSVAAPRGEWATVSISPRDVLTALGAPLREERHTFAQAPYVDVPAIPLELGFFVAAPAGQAATMEIGRIEQTLARPEQLFGRGTETGYTAWRGELSLEHGNYMKAAAWFERADADQPSELRELQAADAYLLAEDWKDAIALYERAAKFRDSPAAAKGLGYAELGAGNIPAAIRAFEHARDIFAATETKPRGGLLDSLRGLSAAHAKAGNCAEARRYVEAIKTEDPSAPSPPIPGCE